ncbi:MAG: glutamate--tRNA ligase family protein [Candidatus Helarchaeota archaeon]
MSKNKIFLPPLPEQDRFDIIRLRFPPEPNGFLHLGNAYSNCIQWYYTNYFKSLGKKSFFFLRFDDTNPKYENIKFYDAIINDLNSLGIHFDKILYSSDFLPEIYKYAIKCIKKNYIYSCSCDNKSIIKNRYTGISCNCKKNNSYSTLKKFKNAIQNFYKEGEIIFRLRGDMKHKNMTFRDAVLFRVINDPHPRLKKKYSLYPTYEFQGPVLDGLLGITHTFKLIHHKQRSELHDFIQEICGFQKSLHFYSGEIVFYDMPSGNPRSLKTKQLMKLIDSWDDYRLGTIKGLIQRGYDPNSIREFLLSIPLTKRNKIVYRKQLDLINRKRIDKKANRYFFIENPSLLIIKELHHGSLQINLKIHPDSNILKTYTIPIVDNHLYIYISNEDFISLKEQDIIRIMGMFPIKILKKKNTRIIAEIYNENIHHKIKSIQWVHKNWAIPATIDYFLPSKDNEFHLEDKIQVKGLVENSILSEKNSIVQFVRKGFIKITQLDKNTIKGHLIHR